MSKKGFTLIELLVVISIIGLLSSVVLASLNSARMKARDAARLSNVRSIKTALELYYDSNNGTYPAGGATDGFGYNITSGSLLATNLAPYVKVPNDPSGLFFQYVRGPAPYGYGIYVSFEARPACVTGVGLAPGADSTHTGYWGGLLCGF